MGKFKRIPVKDINAMRKILDDLPDKNLGKTREEAAELLNANILKAFEKGYTVKEVAAIMAEGNVVIPAPVIRAKVLPAKAAPRKREPKPRPETVKPVAGGNPGLLHAGQTRFGALIMNIQNSVFYVGGSKGGVGKSLFSFALVDYLLNRNANILLVDTDTDNPDVFKAHKDLALPNLLCRLNSLDDADGWADLLDTVQNYPDHAVVINAAARTKTSTDSYGDIMKAALREMRRELVVFWIINRHRDSIELLHSFQEVFTDVPLHVCRNLYFGEARRFDMYNSSKAREAVEKNGMTLDFPAVGNRVADWLYSRRMSIRAAHPEMPFGTRAELQRWRGVCAKMFDSVMGEAS